jgi:hypothetical protein
MATIFVEQSDTCEEPILERSTPGAWASPPPPPKAPAPGGWGAPAPPSAAAGAAPGASAPVPPPPPTPPPSSGAWGSPPTASPEFDAYGPSWERLTWGQVAAAVVQRVGRRPVMCHLAHCATCACPCRKNDVCLRNCECWCEMCWALTLRHYGNHGVCDVLLAEELWRPQRHRAVRRGGHLGVLGPAGAAVGAPAGPGLRTLLGGAACGAQYGHATRASWESGVVM